MQFGRQTWICNSCGGFYYIIDGCRECINARMGAIRVRKAALNKLNGIPSKAAKKRGQKAYISRMANMFFQDTEKFLIALEKLEKRDNDRKRINQIKRQIIKKTKLL